jgi:hypothetical protein
MAELHAHFGDLPEGTPVPKHQSAEAGRRLVDSKAQKTEGRLGVFPGRPLLRYRAGKVSPRVSPSRAKSALRTRRYASSQD